MNVRAQAVAMSAQMQNVSNAIVNQIFPLILNKIGFKAMYMFAGINVLLAGFVWFCIPETKGMALEDMDTLFGGVSHAEKGAAFVECENTTGIAKDGADLSVYEMENALKKKENV